MATQTIPTFENRYRIIFDEDEKLYICMKGNITLHKLNKAYADAEFKSLKLAIKYMASCNVFPVE